jgi:hypothetical protein
LLQLISEFLDQIKILSLELSKKTLQIFGGNFHQREKMQLPAVNGHVCMQHREMIKMTGYWTICYSLDFPICATRHCCVTRGISPSSVIDLVTVNLLMTSKELNHA